MENTNSHPSITSWALLTAEAAECIRRREQPFPNPEYDVWCCNHCLSTTTKQRQRPKRFATPKTSTYIYISPGDIRLTCWVFRHSIDRPRVGVDVIYDRRKLIPIPPRKPTCVGLELPEIYQCVKCPDTINRLWQFDRLKPHLLDK